MALKKLMQQAPTPCHYSKLMVSQLEAVKKEPSLQLQTYWLADTLIWRYE